MYPAHDELEGVNLIIVCVRACVCVSQKASYDRLNGYDGMVGCR